MAERVLVIGENGQLGQSLRKVAADYPAFELEFVGHPQIDLADSQSLAAFMGANPQGWTAIINAAAYTAVDKAETEQTQADCVNHLAVRQLAGYARQQNIFLLHVSTDYVFDGCAYRPWREDDPVAPLNQYGVSKLAGEQAMQAAGCRGAVVRTSWLYSEFGNNFVKTMLRLGREREQLGVIADQVGTPTYATDLAKVLFELLQREQTGSQLSSVGVELYHYSNEGVASWYDFAVAIFELSGVNCLVNPIEAHAYPTPAARPHYSVLNKAKIRQALGIQIPHWRHSLSDCLAALDELAG